MIQTEILGYMKTIFSVYLSMMYFLYVAVISKPEIIKLKFKFSIKVAGIGIWDRLNSTNIQERKYYDWYNTETYYYYNETV